MLMVCNLKLFLLVLYHPHLVNCIAKSSPNTFPFTKEQLDQMYKLLESQTPSCSIAHKDNFPKSTYLSVIPNRSSYKPCA